MTDPAGASDAAELPERLRGAAVELIDEVGPAGFSLREVARRAGVSHQAPGYHFGDKAGLLTAVAIEGFGYLAEALAPADHIADPAERLVALGRAYVRVARRHRAHFAVMFRRDLLHADDPALVARGEAAHGHLIRAVEAVRDRYAPDLDVDTTALHCWSTMQGLVELSDRMPELTAGSDAVEDLAEVFSRQSLRGILPREASRRPGRGG